MHGNTPYAGRPAEEWTPEKRRALRRDLLSVTSRARDLLPDGFAVGAEIVADADGPRATVAVRPPAGTVVTRGFAPGETDPADLARDLAAGAAFEARRAADDVEHVAR